MKLFYYFRLASFFLIWKLKFVKLCIMLFWLESSLADAIKGSANIWVVLWPWGWISGSKIPIESFHIKQLEAVASYSFIHAFIEQTPTAANSMWHLWTDEQDLVLVLNRLSPLVYVICWDSNNLLSSMLK